MNTQEGESGGKVKTGGETQKVGERKVKAGSLRCANAKTRSLRCANAKVRQHRCTLGKFGSDEVRLTSKVCF